MEANPGATRWELTVGREIMIPLPQETPDTIQCSGERITACHPGSTTSVLQDDHASSYIIKGEIRLPRWRRFGRIIRLSSGNAESRRRDAGAPRRASLATFAILLAKTTVPSNLSPNHGFD